MARPPLPSARPQAVAKRPAWLNQDNSYDLLVPVEYKVGEEPQRLTRLQLSRLNGADMLVMDQPISFTEKLFLTLESKTGLPRIVITKIDAVDLDRLDDCFGYFREPGSVTGAIS
ncbi:hypothetical protein QH494_06280 [Sphingomonas sp. AR_OL41]|uniref:hypothetical protein n=1 Tax=Sphingomonas sp. AR_OL41 TaxID=3042729 RepID=UPI0024809C1C|nr:hypothetical protein [Sphingomonas sp. AR_OL41]MDH7971786.1 hypothetical protein [Sphingomonas sp. AR_OL41]